MKKIIIMMLGVLALLGGIILAQGKSEPNNKTEALIKQLGADNYQKREAAQKELTEYGNKLIEQYQAAKKDNKKEISNNLKNDIEKLAQALNNSSNNNDQEVKIRVGQIRQNLHSLSQPKIAFQSTGNPDSKGIPCGSYEIYTINADGSNQYRLTNTEGMDNCSPSWSPDGTKIVFDAGINPSSNGESWAVYVMDADGMNKKNLTEKISGNCSSPSWSPDGTKIVFVVESDRKRDIYTMDIDGKNIKRLTENQSFEHSPAWSPDGKKIAFISQRDGNRKSEIYVMDADGKNQKGLTKDDNYDESPSWNSDGTKIVYQSETSSGSAIYMIDIDGKNQKKILDNAFTPAWSPDGTKIAFASSIRYTAEICVMDIKSSTIQQLTKNQAHNHSPAWSQLSTSEISDLFVLEEKKK